MFAKTQDSAFASAINVSKFDVITVRRDGSNYKLSVYNVPLEGMHAYQDIASFPSSQAAITALDSLMHAMANNEPCWPI